MAQIFVSPDFIIIPIGRIRSDRCAWAVSGQITGFRMAELVFKIYQTALSLRSREIFSPFFLGIGR
jgi:hypothetical protein